MKRSTPIFLLLNIVSLGVMCINIAACSNPDAGEESVTIPVVAAKAPPSDWMRVATLGGASVDHQDTDEDLAIQLNQLVEDGVTVVEFDSRLSNYLSDIEFAKDLVLMRRIVNLARQRNLKTVWYYPALEVLTIGGETLPNSMYKDHPDWIQLSADGTPNVFYGSKVFWVNPGDESAWMEPLSGWRNVYIDRAKMIAQTGVDGVWMDVPLYNDIVGKWASHNPLSTAKFLADTGYSAPTLIPGGDVLDINANNTRIWLNWRHHEIDSFIKDVLIKTRTVAPNFNLIVETVTMDYNAAILEGLDGSFQGAMDGLWHVWEVDVVSDTNAMYNARENDFISLIAMYKYGRGADKDRAAWAFTYGSQSEDAEVVMAIAAAAQVNPYELKSPEMTTTVGRPYRKQMFSWIRSNEDVLFRSTSDARVLLLHSSASRDYIDGKCIMDGLCGVSLFSTWSRPAPQIAWWTPNQADSLDASNYMAEYRGMVKALVDHHVPFDLMPARLLMSGQVGNYDVVVAPSLEALSDSEHLVLTTYVSNGGKVIFTGSKPGQLNETGLPRAVPLFAEISTAVPGQCLSTQVGTGVMAWCNQNLGKSYIVNNDINALAIIGTQLSAAKDSVLQTDVSTGIYFEVYSTNNKTAIHTVNYKGADGTFSVVPATFNIKIPTGTRGVKRITRTSPTSSGPTDIAFTTTNGSTSFIAENVGTWTLFIMEYN